MKIVINTCFGGFGLSDDALAYYHKLSGTTVASYEIERTDPHLIEVVEVLGVDAEGNYADLKIVEIPDDVQWEITYYDGLESVREVSRTWR